MSAYGTTPTKCECDHEFHRGNDCANAPADHGSVVASPALCLPCLFGCAE